MKSVSLKSIKEAKKAFDEGKPINAVVHKFAHNNDMAFTEAKTIILFVIGIVIFAALIPTAIATIHSANVTGWSTAETSLWNIFGLIVIGIAVYKLID